jgi:dienelactone hydrolase
MSCPDCFKGAIHDGKPAGREEVLHGVKTYIAGTSSDSNPEATITFLTDAFGFNLPNSLLLADYYALKTSHRVLVPDIIPGGGVPLSTLSLMNIVTAPVAWYNIFGQLKRIFYGLRLMTIVLPFARRTKGAFPEILKYARAVKAESNGKLGVAGFCWGGMMSTKLALQPEVEGGKEGLVDAHFCAHPAGLQPEDIVEGVRRFGTPLSLAVGDKDFVMKREQVGEVERGLRGDGVGESEVIVYAGCGHGFAVRADKGKEAEDVGAGKAAEQAVGWFGRVLG